MKLFNKIKDILRDPVSESFAIRRKCNEARATYNEACGVYIEFQRAKADGSIEELEISAAEHDRLTEDHDKLSDEYKALSDSYEARFLGGRG